MLYILGSSVQLCDLTHKLKMSLDPSDFIVKYNAATSYFRVYNPLAVLLSLSNNNLNSLHPGKPSIPVPIIMKWCPAHIYTIHIYSRRVAMIETRAGHITPPILGKNKLIPNANKTAKRAIIIHTYYIAEKPISQIRLHAVYIYFSVSDRKCRKESRNKVQQRTHMVIYDNFNLSFIFSHSGMKYNSFRWVIWSREPRPPDEQAPRAQRRPHGWCGCCWFSLFDIGL